MHTITLLTYENVCSTLAIQTSKCVLFCLCRFGTLIVVFSLYYQSVSKDKGGHKGPSQVPSRRTSFGGVGQQPRNSDPGRKDEEKAESSPLLSKA
jgi:hypothetical protein